MNPLNYYRSLVIVAGLGPLLMLGWDAWHDQLGANSVNNALHITGILSLVFLFTSLAITPLQRLTGWNGWIAFRRALGLYGFAYAALHLGIYVGWDRMGSLQSTFEEISTRRFLWAGSIAFAVMIPLALTSTNAMIRTIGATRWKRLHRLAYVAAALGVVHYYMLVKSDVRQPLAFAAVLAPLLGFRIVQRYWPPKNNSSQRASRRDLPTPAGNFWTGELSIKSIQAETHDVKTFRLTHPDGPIPFSHRPGQYMTLTLHIHGKIVKRSYTIASSPHQRDYVELTIKRDPKGLASRHLHDEVQVGDSIRISAPAGKFVFDSQPSSGVVLIAGGVGITPVMSILRNLTANGWQGAIYFVQAIRTPKDRIFEAELAEMANRFENLHVLTAYSQSKPHASASISSKRWEEKAGYIQADDLQRFIPALNDLPIFLCGPEPMMEAVRTACASLGVPPSHLVTEAFVSPPSANRSDRSTNAGASQESDQTSIESALIHFARSQKSIDIDATSTILEAAEQSGVALPWECRAGICGQCKVRCKSGRVQMESRDALTDAEEANGFILACQSRPTTESVTIEA